MLERAVDFFVSWFIYPDILWTSLLVAIGLAIAFGAFWFTPYWTPILKKPWAWGVLLSSAILSVAASAFIQIPLQTWTVEALVHFWGEVTIYLWFPLAGIPLVLIGGLVQEGAKLVPIVVYWWRKGRNIDPKLGLAIGAVAGVGFGVFEAVWTHNFVFLRGWSWELVQTQGLLALTPFLERFLSVALHIALSGLAGYGLAKGWGWQFYLLASFLHALNEYAVVLIEVGIITLVQLELYAAVVAALVTGGALWLRWRKSEAAYE
jgi:RsiW-degrading membrane proteinase PrsW (M82 family)